MTTDPGKSQDGADHAEPAGEPAREEASADARTRIALPASDASDLPDATRIAPGLGPELPPASADATRIATSALVPPDAGTRIAEIQPQPVAQVVAPGVLINDNYRVLKTISAGGMGEVYRAENIFTGDPVAVKIILPGLARDQAIIDLFRSEARILVQMRDDAIVRYHNFVRDRGLDRYCLIMEFVEGQHLWDYVEAHGPLDADQALILIRRLAHGLAEAHGRGITHRDLSPDNVILRDNRLDEAVLIDFGIARSTELGDGLGGRFAGKFKYIAPEQLGHGRGEIGPRADIYGLALMIAAALRGKALEMGSSVVEASDARRRIPDLSGISHRLYPLLQHMLEPDPERRPEDLAAVLRILDDPSHLPSRYRLPLWQEAEPGASGQAQSSLAPVALTGALGPSGFVTGASLAEVDSASPFGALLPDPPAPAVTPRRSVARHWVYAGLVVLAAFAGAGGFYAMRNGPAPAPLDPALTDPVVPKKALAPTTLALPARNLALRDGFLADQPLPPCTFASQIATGANAGKIGVLADGPRDLAAMQARYSAQFKTSAALFVGEITLAQCPALDLLRALSGRAAAPPVLSLDELVVTSGGETSGRIRDLNGRSLWLFLVSPKGGVCDLSRIVTAQADGSFTFQFGISLAADETGAQPQLLLALASEKPLASVAAAPSGSDAGKLLPFALDEIVQNGGQSALAVARMEVIALEPADDAAPEPALPNGLTDPLDN